MSKYKVTKILGVTLVAGGLVTGGVLGLTGKSDDEKDKAKDVSAYNKPPLDRDTEEEKKKDDDKEEDDKEEDENTKKDSNKDDSSDEGSNDGEDTQEDDAKDNNTSNQSVTNSSNDTESAQVASGSDNNNSGETGNSNNSQNASSNDSNVSSGNANSGSNSNNESNDTNSGNSNTGSNKDSGSSNNSGNKENNNNKGNNDDKGSENDKTQEALKEIAEKTKTERELNVSLVQEKETLEVAISDLEKERDQLVAFKGTSNVFMAASLSSILDDMEGVYEGIKEDNNELEKKIDELKVTKELLEKEVGDLRNEEIVKEETTVEAVHYETKEEKTDDLLEGETKVLQVGKDGKAIVKNKVTYKNMKVVGTPEELSREVIADSVEEVISVGTRVDIENREEYENESIDYKVIEMEDDQLEQGEKEVLKKGVKGEEKVVYDVTYEVRYKDEKEVERKEVSREVIKEPIAEIVKVGTMEVEIKEETEEKVLPYSTVEIEDPTIEKGETKVDQKGKDGKEVVTYEVRYENGKKVDSVRVNVDVVEPVNEIILVGTKVTEVKEEIETNYISFDVIEEEDPTLEKGETRVVQEGKDGREDITYEVTYVNGKPVGDAKETGRVTVYEPVDEIVKVGTKVTEVKIESTEKDIDFKTVEKEDNTLEEGKTKVKQKGVKGIEKTTYKVTYVNGKKETTDLVRKEVIKEPVNEIILVGTMTVDVKEETKENVIPYKTTEKEDFTLEKGKTKVEQKGKDGKEVVTYEVRYENGKKVDSKEVGREVAVKPVEEIILIGAKEPEDVVEVKEEIETKDVAYETVEQEDPTLEKGETKVKQEGKKGTEEITYEVTYRNGEKVDKEEVSRKVTVKPVDEVILVGTKVTEITEETETEEIDFETITEEDPTLEKGKEVVEQEGKNGTKEVVYEVTVVNGEIVDRVVKSTTVVEEPVNKIVKVGTKEVVTEAMLEQQMFDLVNQERVENGKSPLVRNGIADSVARATSQLGGSTHTEGLSSQLKNSGIVNLGAAGEIVAVGSGTPESILYSWLNSPAHNSIMKTDYYTHTGIGYSEETNKWTQIFYSEYDRPEQASVPEDKKEEEKQEPKQETKKEQQDTQNKEQEKNNEPVQKEQESEPVQETESVQEVEEEVEDVQQETEQVEETEEQEQE